MENAALVPGSSFPCPSCTSYSQENDNRLPNTKATIATRKREGIKYYAASRALAGAGIFKLGNYPSLHVGLVAIAFILIVLSMYLAPRLIPQFQPRTPTIVRWVLRICTVIMVALGQVYIPIGVAQRLAESCIHTWLVWLAIFNRSSFLK